MKLPCNLAPYSAGHQACGSQSLWRNACGVNHASHRGNSWSPYFFIRSTCLDYLLSLRTEAFTENKGDILVVKCASTRRKWCYRAPRPPNNHVTKRAVRGPSAGVHPSHARRTTEPENMAGIACLAARFDAPWFFERILLWRFTTDRGRLRHSRRFVPAAITTANRARRSTALLCARGYGRPRPGDLISQLCPRDSLGAV